MQRTDQQKIGKNEREQNGERERREEKRQREI